MSLHYAWTMSLRLRPDTPDDVIAGVRFLLGLGPAPEIELPVDYPAFEVPAPNEDPLPGGSVALLRPQQVYLNQPPMWGVFVRSALLDDDAEELIGDVLPWFARWSRTQGWIGGMREELSLRIAENWEFFVQDGYAYAASNGSGIFPLTEDAPPFTLQQTSD